MTITLSLSYSDLQCMVSYTSSLANMFNYAGSLLAVPHQEKARHKADLSEMLEFNNKLNKKLFGWPADKRHKKIRNITVSYMQAYILWSHYGRDQKFILINDKIEFIAKQLTN